MPKFLVLYESSVPPREMMAQATPEQMQEGMDAWGQWAGKAGSGVVDLGSPVSAEGTVGGGGGNDRVTGFSILQADSKDDVERMLDGHPHLQSPGEPSIAVYEFLALPGM
jgi:hypothetical protein